MNAEDKSDPVRRAQALSRPERPRRFYAQVAVREADGAFAVALDGRIARTPAGVPLAAPTRDLAEALAEEWRAQGETVDANAMPMTRLANAAIDGVAHAGEATREGIANYAESDLVCYRADGPDGLVARQNAHWGPLVAWAEEGLGARLALAAGVMHVPQSAQAMAAVRAALAGLDTWSLTAVHVMTTLTGSAVIALAVQAGRLDAGEAWSAAHVDEDWNIAQWGEDAEAAARRAARERDMRAAVRLAGLVRSG